MQLDKNSPIPLYYQLAEHLRAQIESGELKPGDQVAPEREMSEQAGISRMTVRQAIAYLVQQGVLLAQVGRGTFVAEPKLSFDAAHVLGFSERLMLHGMQIRSQVLEQTVLIAPPSVAARLQLKSHAKVIKVVRLRLHQALPLALETVYLPVALCPNLEKQDLQKQSLYKVLETKYRLRFEGVEQSVEAVIANDYEAELFGVQTCTPLILLEGVTYTVPNRATEFFKAVFRGDRFKMDISNRPDMDQTESAAASRVMMRVH